MEEGASEDGMLEQQCVVRSSCAPTRPRPAVCERLSMDQARCAVARRGLPQ